MEESVKIIVRCILIFALALVQVSGRTKRQSSNSPLKARNIVFIVADDMGWNDIGYNNPEIKTPVLNELASKGIILNHAYVQPSCTPSRAAFMSGVYPFRYIQQRGAIRPDVPRCEARDHKLLPSFLQELGYSTHIVGKWHLGHCNWNCTPTERGFDTFYGFYNGAEDYYKKMMNGGHDFRDNKVTIKDETYSTFLYSKRAERIIREHNQSKPLFLYLPFQAVHSPVQVPQQYTDLYPNIELETRRKYSGMVTAMDEAIGNITKALDETKMLKDTLIIFTSDNGGFPTIAGSNLPFRGAKSAVYEGGTRVPSFVYGSGIQRNGFTYEGWFHAVDWLPTVLEAAGKLDSINGIDGTSQWTALRNNGISPRTEIVYNLTPFGNSAIRVGSYKLIEGYPGLLRDWYNNTEDFRPDLVPIDGDDSHVAIPLYAEDLSLRPELFTGYQLFNLEDDPEERNEISADHPDIVSNLLARMEEYRPYVPPQQIRIVHPNADPSYYNGFWGPGFC